ncbi:MAG: pilus assembly protein TadE [Anaerolinea sp.]|nr:pilus assembly protein TadE [Anaerolinea sp.]
MSKSMRLADQLNPLPFSRRGLLRLRRTEAGQSLVEFAMVLPFFLVLLFGLVDFGRAFYTWLQVTNAAREGARAAAVQLDGSAINTRIYNSICKTYPTSCSLDTTKMVITKTNVQGARGESASVNISYAFSYVTPLGAMIALLPGASGAGLTTPTITGYSSMRLE